MFWSCNGFYAYNISLKTFRQILLELRLRETITVMESAVQF